ncbi:L,D-transpeptidase family protein [Bacillus sp. FJAT-45350]|uniref:L,D-transpeptidase family protein n=1 Tax=Bacillus sp. FJAT-45350 TaxID=2011014 RepID=UPI00211CCF78|nr:stalk domain-containing protein [Bacillus sp. FJAT-45350]
MKWFLVCILMIANFTFVAPNEAQGSQTGQLIIINKSINQLAFFEAGELVRVFDVGTGRTDELTPEGTFPIVNKIKNRPYYKEGIRGGDPANPLGDRWLGLDARGTYGTTYAIHGNNNPSSIGKYVSAGCVRMYNDEVKWLFDRVRLHTNVIILKSQKSFEEIARANGYSMLEPIKVKVNNKELALPQEPIVRNGRILVPIRGIFEELGATVSWNPSNQTVHAWNQTTNVSLGIGDRKATVNGKIVSLDVPAITQSGRTLVPVRFISESLGASVSWSGEKRLLTINHTPKVVEPKKEIATVKVNGENYKFATDPFLENGTVMVPMRGIFEALGVPLGWDGATQTIRAINEDINIQLKVGSSKAIINDTEVHLSQPAKNVNGSVVVPARFISESLGAAVQWDSEKKEVNIVK